MRVRKQQEKGANQTNRTTIDRHNININSHIDGLTDNVDRLFEHQKAELEREYQSKVAKTHAEIENKFNAKQDNALSL